MKKHIKLESAFFLFKDLSFFIEGTQKLRSLFAKRRETSLFEKFPFPFLFLLSKKNRFLQRFVNRKRELLQRERKTLGKKGEKSNKFNFCRFATLLFSILKEYQPFSLSVTKKIYTLGPNHSRLFIMT